MKRIRQYLLDVYLILLDMDYYAKKQMVMELGIAVVLFVLGIIWGRQWFFMATIVLLYVIFDTYSAFKNGVIDVMEVTGTVTGIKRVVTGRRIWVLTPEDTEKSFILPYGIANTRIRTGDRVTFFLYPLEERGQIKVMDYRIYHAGRNKR